MDRLVKRIEAGWTQAQKSGDDLYFDSVALNLHGFYEGIERLFELTATLIDGDMPQGANWHQLLLHQMANEIENVRPALISEMARNALDEYRGFRHVVRHVYTFQFDPAKLETLTNDVLPLFAQVRNELLAFAKFLDQQQ